MRKDQVALLIVLTFCAVLFALGLACDDSEEQDIKMDTPYQEDTPKVCTCTETIDMVYTECARTLTGQDGFPIDQGDALTGCSICQADATQYPVYCCLVTCCGENDTCDGNDEEDGMNTCINACLDQYAPTPTPEPSPTPPAA